MSFKTEYHVDVSFLHDLTTSAPPRPRMPREEYLKYKKMLSLAYKNGEKATKETLQKEMLRKLGSLSELHKQCDEKEAKCVEKQPSETLESSEKKIHLTEDMNNLFFEKASTCTTLSPSDMFIIMWKKLDYDNKIKVREYLYTKNTAESNFTKPNIISRTLFKYIDEDIFQTLRNLAVPDFNTGYYSRKYLEEVLNLAKRCTVTEDDQFMKIWQELDDGAKYYLTTYFENKSDVPDKLKEFVKYDTKASEAKTAQRSRQQILAWASRGNPLLDPKKKYISKS